MHLTPMSVMENTEIVGVCDIKEDRANAAGKKYNAKVYTDYKKMITELKPDIVHVCVPHYLHSYFCGVHFKSPLCTKSVETKKWQYRAKHSVLPQTKAI